MERPSIHILIEPTLFNKNPESTELGRTIVSNSIVMINELGFESFTFKKLGKLIGSNESSIYRYFSSKQALLIYLINWYWTFIEYEIAFSTTNINDPSTRLKNTIKLITGNTIEGEASGFINIKQLHNIIISESAKAYYNKDIVDLNKKGHYKSYKRVLTRLSNIILEVNPLFEFPVMLASTIIHGAHHQHYFSQKLPELTNHEFGKNNVECLYTELVFNTLNN